MTDMQTLYLLVPLAPLVGAILAGLFGKTIGRAQARFAPIGRGPIIAELVNAPMQMQVRWEIGK